MPSDDEPVADVNWNHAIYQLGKLGDVVHVLVVGEGDARSRLRQAAKHLQALVPGMLPQDESIRPRVERALATLHRFHDPATYGRRASNSPETEFDATLNRIRNSTASQVALDLWSAYGSLGDMVDQHFRDLGAGAHSSEPLPPVLILQGDSPESLVGLPEGAVIFIDDVGY